MTERKGSGVKKGSRGIYRRVGGSFPPGRVKLELVLWLVATATKGPGQDSEGQTLAEEGRSGKE